MASTLPAYGCMRAPPVVEVATVLANVEKPDDCESTGQTPFDNSQFVGLSQTWTACAGGTTDVVIVAARPADDAFNLLAIVHEEVGDGMLSTIIESLAIEDPTMYPPESPETPVTPEGTVPESLWQRPAGADTVIVIDRLRRIKVEVPSSWMDVRNLSVDRRRRQREAADRRFAAHRHDESAVRGPRSCLHRAPLRRRRAVPRRCPRRGRFVSSGGDAVLRQRHVHRLDAHLQWLWHQRGTRRATRSSARPTTPPRCTSRSSCPPTTTRHCRSCSPRSASSDHSIQLATAVAGRIVARKSSRARATRDLIVPIGQPTTTAASS